jgi:hypothetical protein
MSDSGASLLQSSGITWSDAIGPVQIPSPVSPSPSTARTAQPPLAARAALARQRRSPRGKRMECERASRRAAGRNPGRAVLPNEAPPTRREVISWRRPTGGAPFCLVPRQHSRQDQPGWWTRLRPKPPISRGSGEGADRNRTGVHGFAGRCVTTPPRRRRRSSVAVPWALPPALSAARPLPGGRSAPSCGR